MAYAATEKGLSVLLRLTEARFHKLWGGVGVCGQERSVIWQASRWDGRAQAGFPAQAAVAGRILVAQLQAGSQTEFLYLFTTLDLPAQRILEIYRCRWYVETDLRSLKTAIRLHHLTAKTKGCHGEDGSGGEHGPSILDVQRPRATSREAVRNLILKGIPDGGMPAFRIGADEADKIAGYVMRLKQQPAGSGAAAGGGASGDAAAGERFFTGKGNCSSCHMVRGRGGVLVPTCRTSDMTALLRRLNGRCAIPGSSICSDGPRRTRRAQRTVLSRRGRTIARRPNHPRDREKR
jgi:mono/diheme cytochrome c family protein